MNIIPKWDCLLRGVKGFLSVTAGLIFVSLALGYKAWVVNEQAQLGEVLLWLFLAAWGKVLAVGVMGVLLILMIVRALGNCQERKAVHFIGDNRKNVRMPRSLTGAKCLPVERGIPKI